MTSRGDRREDIYRDDEDREDWLAVFSQVCKRFNWRCHAWCLMSNHYHVLVETPEGNLSQGMRQLNGVYTQRFNRRHKLVGHLFQGRFKGILVEQDSYLLELSRYVVLNPVRARMVEHAGEWKWSSYASMVGQSPIPEWLETDWLLGQFGADRTAASLSYARFVDEGIGRDSIWSKLRHQLILGGEAFAEQVRAQQGMARTTTLDEITRAQRRAFAPSLADFPTQYDSREMRNEALAAAYATGAYTMYEIAAHFGVHYATVSRSMRQWEEATRKE